LIASKPAVASKLDNHTSEVVTLNCLGALPSYQPYEYPTPRDGQGPNADLISFGKIFVLTQNQFWRHQSQNRIVAVPIKHFNHAMSILGDNRHKRHAKITAYPIQDKGICQYPEYPKLLKAGQSCSELVTDNAPPP
jgi:hypothetical protein